MEWDKWQREGAQRFFNALMIIPVIMVELTMSHINICMAILI
jgi:hypothetical protein